MSFFRYLLYSALLLSTACSSAEQAATQVPAAAGQAASPQAALSTNTLPPEEGESLSSVLENQVPTQGPKSGQPEPEVLWDDSPEALIVSATNCCGFVPEFVKLNYIPEAQIWGDGRIVWVQPGADNTRNVLEGKLGEDQLTALLQRAVADGFFGWEELYTSPAAPSDLPTRCVYVQLEIASRKVCEYYEGAPQAFQDLYADLASGAGATGQPYAPEEAYLTAYPFPAPDQPTQEGELAIWDVDRTGVSLSQAVDGMWLSGPALEEAWKIVNQTPFVSAAQEGDTFYTLSLQIPGVSLVQPPSK
jgi:hypothetical protein